MAQQVNATDLRAGFKIELEGQPYTVVTTEFVKPGKAQPFSRIKLKHLLTGRVIERTFKTGEKAEVADVQESSMRMLYKEPNGVVFMDDTSFEQVTIPLSALTSVEDWLMEDQIYSIVTYKGAPITVEAPTFMELTITETSPGVRGDTASGRVMKPATLSTGAKVQIPIFVEEGELVKFDTRTGEYVSRVSK
ncbi:MAG: elongation factor P [Chlamydiales bacterium]|nr:elongation factor P [Chlamydiales bacterium]